MNFTSCPICWDEYCSHTYDEIQEYWSKGDNEKFSKELEISEEDFKEWDKLAKQFNEEQYKKRLQQEEIDKVWDEAFEYELYRELLKVDWKSIMEKRVKDNFSGRVKDE